MNDGVSYSLLGRVFSWFRFIVLVLWLAIAVALSIIATDDRLIFFFINTRPGNLARGFWWIYLFSAPFVLAFAVCVRSLKQATVSAGVLLVAVAVLLWGTPIDDGVVFRSKLPAYREFVARAAGGHCSHDEAWKLGIPLDALACDKPMLFVFPWEGFMSAWRGVIYDETEEIAELPQQRSKEWKSREAARLLSCIGVDAGAAMGGHYYIAYGNFAC